MSNILMLDLEGVLIATAIPPIKRLENNDYGIRPHAKEFLEETIRIFDKVYLNTCVREGRALKVLKDVFNTESIEYYHWNRGSQFGKTGNYDEFQGHTLIHVEDELINNKEAKHCIELGCAYVQVKGWYPYHAWHPDYEEFRKNDKELLITLEKIKNILNKLSTAKKS